MRRGNDDSSLIAIDNMPDGSLGFYVRPDSLPTGQPAPLIHLVAPGVANDGRWHHFALVRNTAANVEVYVDGALLASAPAGPSSGPITTDLRSLAVEFYRPKGLQFEGCVDDFCIYGRALSADEIRKLAGARPR
jgi:hypothetical protein